MTETTHCCKAPATNNKKCWHRFRECLALAPAQTSFRWTKNFHCLLSFLSRRALSFLTANIMPSVRFFFAVFSAFLLFFRMIYRRNHVTQPALNQLFTLSKSFERASLSRRWGIQTRLFCWKSDLHWLQLAFFRKWSVFTASAYSWSRLWCFNADGRSAQRKPASRAHLQIALPTCVFTVEVVETVYFVCFFFDVSIFFWASRADIKGSNQLCFYSSESFFLLKPTLSFSAKTTNLPALINETLLQCYVALL